MIPPSPSNAAGAARPDIHLWMDLDDAVASLGISIAEINEKIDMGELESRINRQGITEVLVSMPRKPPAVAPAKPDVQPAPDGKTAQDTTAEPDSILSRAIPSDAALLPLMQALRWTQSEDVRRARRSARVGWAAAAVMLLAICAAAALATYNLAIANDQTQILSDKLNQLSETAGRLSGERDKLAAQLAEYRQASARAEGELAVERKVEDTLFKAALGSRAGTQSQPGRPAFADTNN